MEVSVADITALTKTKLPDALELIIYWEGKRDQIGSQEGWYFPAQLSTGTLTSTWNNWLNDATRFLQDWSAKNAGSLTPPFINSTLLSHQQDIIMLVNTTSGIRKLVQDAKLTIDNTGATAIPEVPPPGGGGGATDTTVPWYVPLIAASIAAVAIIIALWMVLNHKKEVNAQGRAFTEGWVPAKREG